MRIYDIYFNMCIIYKLEYFKNWVTIVMMIICEPGTGRQTLSTITQAKRYLWINDQQEESGISLYLYLIAD